MEGGRLVVTPKMCKLFDSYVGKHQILKQIGKSQWVNIGNLVQLLYFAILQSCKKERFCNLETLLSVYRQHE